MMRFDMLNRFLMGRRQFLKASSTCVVAATAMGPKLFASEVPGGPAKRLAVGFASFDEGEALASATTIPSGDGHFIGRGARVTVSGVSGASVNPGANRVVELLVHHSYLDGAERKVAPFRAWASSRVTGCQGNTVSFSVPVHDVQTLSMTLAAEFGQVAGAPASRRRALRSAGSGSVALPVSLGLQQDAPMKLVRGFYVLVPVFEGEAEPRWSDFRMRRLNGRFAMVGWNEVAPFEHIVLSVDYVSA